MYRYCISQNSRLIDALIQLNNLHSYSMTLFVVDNEDRMVGTLTDGDIRRSLISGKGIECPVHKAMHQDFSYIRDIHDIRGLKKLREQNINLIPLLDSEKHILDVVDLYKYKSSLPVDAVLMAGGKGERLRPLTLEIPKPLLKIGDKAIIDRNIDRLIEYGIRHISVTVNYLKEQLIDYYENPKPSGVKIDCVAEQQFFGTIGALKLVKEFHNDTILVMNSDLLTDIDFEDFSRT